jgi:methionine-rich copper-binding protein CopC
LLKRINTLTVILTVIMVPAMVFAADSFAPADAAVADNTVTVPLEITNQDGVMAIDIPLKWSEGVTLREVTFEGTRVEDFDLTVANINNEDNVVIIGLISQITPTTKPALEAGTGPVANLVFEVDDPSVSEITLSAVELKKPDHKLMWVYNRRPTPESNTFVTARPDFEQVSIALSGAVSDGMPKSYALDQNYPNPFNPTTEVAFALPKASHVELSVFNVLGQKVTTLVSGEYPAGNHTVTWNGTNSDGGSVSSGVYFYRIQAEGYSQTRKMMLLK